MTSKAKAANDEKEDQTEDAEQTDIEGEEHEGEGRGPGRPRNELPEIAKKGDNYKPIIEAIRDSFKTVGEWQDKRENANAQIQAVREKLHALGIPKEAFDLASRYLEWPEDKRRNFDLAYALCRDAAGMPIQKDLFDDL